MHQTVISLQCQCLNLLMIAHGDLRKSKPTKFQKNIQGNHDIERGKPVDSEIPEWLQEFREKFGG